MPGMRRGFSARAMRRSNSAGSMPRRRAMRTPRGFPRFFARDARNIADNSIVMNPLLRDFCGHQVWADAELWRAIGAHAPARDDKAIRDRLHHIAIVQRAFIWATGDRAEEFVFTTPEDFRSFDDLKAYAREHH